MSRSRTSPSDRRRAAARVQARIEQRLSERQDAWDEGDGRSEFLIVRQDGDKTPGRGDEGYLHRETAGSLKGLHPLKRQQMHGTRLGGSDA